MGDELREVRVQLTVDQADKLDVLSNGRGLSTEDLAAQLLGDAVERTELTGEEMSRILDGIPGAWERIQLGREQARRGETISLEEWNKTWRQELAAKDDE